MNRLRPLLVALAALLSVSCLFDKDGGSEHPYCEGGEQKITVYYGYDRNDSLIRLTNVTIFGDTSMDSWYEYDESGFTTKYSFIMRFEGLAPISGCHLNGWVFEGFRIRSTDCEDSTNVFSYTQLDSLGRVSRIEYTRAFGQPERTMYNIYDDAGSLVRIEFEEAGSPRYARAEITNDSAGHWTAWKEFDAQGKMLWRHTNEKLRPDLEKARTYDSLDVLRSWETSELNARGKAVKSIGCEAR